MLTHKQHGAIIPKSGRTMRDLEGPAHQDFAFLGGSGWIGVQCACGAYLSARSMPAVQAAVADHQDPAYCPAAAAQEQLEDEYAIDE